MEEPSSWLVLAAVFVQLSSPERTDSFNLETYKWASFSSFSYAYPVIKIYAVSTLCVKINFAHVYGAVALKNRLLLMSIGLYAPPIFPRPCVKIFHLFILLIRYSGIASGSTNSKPNK